MDAAAVEQEPAWKRFLTPWKIATVLVVAFLISQAYFTFQDQRIIAALEAAPAFATPELKLSFSKKIQYDPLSFVGRGAHAGFWTWTPQGPELTPDGNKYFRLDGDMIVSQASAGRRKLFRILNKVVEDGSSSQYRIDFSYKWSEVSPAAAALLVPPPDIANDRYLGRAAFNKGTSGWELTSLETHDFDEPLAHLQSIASGILQ